MQMNKNGKPRCWTCSLVLSVSSRNLCRIFDHTISSLAGVSIKDRDWSGFQFQNMYSDQNCLHLLRALTWHWASFPLQSLCIAFIELTTVRKYVIYLLTSLLFACPNPTLITHLNGYVKPVRPGIYLFSFSSVSPVPRMKSYTLDNFNRCMVLKRYYTMLYNFLHHAIMVRDTFILVHSDLSQLFNGCIVFPSKELTLSFLPFLYHMRVFV